MRSSGHVVDDCRRDGGSWDTWKIEVGNCQEVLREMSL